MTKNLQIPLMAALGVAFVMLPITASARQPNEPPGQQPPTLNSGPTITGSTLVGQTLTGNTGDWSGVNVSYTYQWQRCDTSGNGCAAIDGALSPSYGLSSADVGYTFRVGVTASNKNGSASVVSDASGLVGPVPAPAPAPAAPPPPPTTTTTATPTPTPTTTPTTTSTQASTPATSTDVTDRWYSSSSAFNAAIPINPPIHPNSSAFVSALNSTYCPNQGCLGPADYYSVPSVWIATSSTPLVTVEINFPSSCHQSTVQVPIPSGATAALSGDPEPVMTVLRADTGDEWDFYKVTPPGVTPVNSSGPQNCPADGNWQATAVFRHSPGWTSDGVGASSRASGTFSGAGTIRPRDTKLPPGSTWDHALAFAYMGATSAHVAPAIGSDGSCGNSAACVPMGARLQLDPSIDCATWPSITAEWMRQECRTLQKYGAIVIDSGNGFVAEGIASAQSSNPSADGGGSGYRYPWNLGGGTHLPPDLASHLRVIDWTRWTG
jgi:hypothetical protein